ncbi:putative glycosyl transferase [Oceaniovalibus guishaninsula JLT2003]|uniref:Putative glycosyl transferase n=1 Tax=Oceaniovalibus guishaninsula JLT2003 TaxID=1231392 RepID=K2HE58_9RHOB|nr:glycosyltransferase [Oceaniovalibus guishaninsula]EKE44822.1 putative glycosyl transferase [Oceaniovalibus guishaninsula JLT2003]
MLERFFNRRNKQRPAAPKPPVPQHKADAPLPRAKARRVSFVVPAYNVAPYIDRFLASLFGQSSALRNFEVIVVDDGSTDRTGEIVREWRDRYPDHLRYVHQPNAGAAAARNTGLKLARGTWVAFPDPDDFLDVDHVRKMLKETEAAHAKPLLAVVSNMVFYHETTDTFSDSHPLRYRFQKGLVRKPTDDLGDFMQLSVNLCWFRRDVIARHGVQFDTRIAPAFEDAHFVNRLFLLAPGHTVSFVPAAKYYYRKREAGTSLLDGTKTHIGWFSTQIELGSLDLLQFAERIFGSVPRYIQRTCLYDLFWRFRYLVDHDERATFLTDDQRAQFLRLVRAVMDRIDVSVIETFDLAGCTEEHKVALLALYKGRRRGSPAVYVTQFDRQTGAFQFQSMGGGDDDFIPRIVLNGRDVSPQLQSRRSTRFFGQPYSRQNLFWVAMEDGDDIRFEVDGTPCRIRRGGTALGNRADWLTLRNALVPARPAVTGQFRRLRDHVMATRDRFRDCMVLMDRDDRADDNAEHLYRHMMRTGRATNAWFILDPKSSDWDRLAAEGFRLLPYGSDDHIAAQMNARFLISSHADEYVLWPVPKAQFGDLARAEFVFLQHGVAIGDMSAWLNSKPIRLFVTTMPVESESLGSSSSPYVFSEREVLLSGLPRHDALKSKADACNTDMILFAPTWRKYLTALNEADGERRSKVPTFAESKFFDSWGNLLRSDALKSLADRHGLTVCFAPHPNMAMYIDDMALPSHLHIVDFRKGVPYQNLFARARVAVSDYSSAVFDVAYLQKPLIYFQFDEAEIFSGGHISRRGYFSFERDGFGPVARDVDGVLAHLERALSGQENPVYARRRQAAFPFRDGGCCERVCAALERLTDRRPGLSLLHATQGTVRDDVPDSASAQAPVVPLREVARLRG